MFVDDGTNFVDDSLHLGYISPEEIIYNPVTNNNGIQKNIPVGNHIESGAQNFQTENIKQVYRQDQELRKYPTHQCPHCSRCFKKKRYLDNHVRTHTGEKPFLCRFCTKGFHQYAGQYQHEKRCPARLFSKPSADPSEQQETGRIRLNSSVSISIVRQGTEGQAKEVVEVRDSTVDTGSNKMPSSREYNGNKIQKIGETNGNNMPSIQETNGNKQAVSNVKEGLQCRFCSKVFQLKIQVIVHERTHTGQDSHPCHYCNMRFSQVSSRDRHQELCPQRKTAENLESKDNEDAGSDESFVCPINVVKLVDLTDGVEEEEEEEQDESDTNDMEPDENGTENVEDEEEEEIDDVEQFACSFCTTQFITATSLAIHEAMCSKDKRRSQTQSLLESQKVKVPTQQVFEAVEKTISASSLMEWSKVTSPLDSPPATVAAINVVGTPETENYVAQVTESPDIIDAAVKGVTLQVNHHQKKSDPALTQQTEVPVAETITEQLDSTAHERGRAQLPEPADVMDTNAEEVQADHDNESSEVVPPNESSAEAEESFHENEIAECERSPSPPILQRQVYHVPRGNPDEEHSRSYETQLYPCRYCEKMWKYPSERERHEKRHLGKREFQCGKCGRAFVERYELFKHSCRIADNLETNVPSLSSGLREGLRQRKSKTICEESSERRDSTDKLNGSVRRQEYSFSCTYCRETFAQKFLCDLHMMECGRKSSKPAASPYTFTESNESSSASSPAPASDLTKSVSTKQPPKRVPSVSSSVTRKAGSRSSRASDISATESRDNPAPVKLLLSRDGPSGQFKLGGRKMKPCPKCHKQFTHGHSLTIHMNVHNNIRPYVCKKCGSAYNNPGNLARHKPRCTGVPSKRLPLSARVKPRKVPPYVMKRVPPKKPKPTRESVRYLPQLTKIIDDRERTAHSCNFCGKTGCQKSEMVRHTRVHLGPNIFYCPCCPARFPSRDEVIWHVKTNKKCAESLGDQQEGLSYAERYPEVFKYVQESGSGKTKVYSCTICGKSWSGRDAAYRIRDHMSMHLGVANHQCELCDKSFLRPYMLRQHIAAEHPGENSMSVQGTAEQPISESSRGRMLRKRNKFCCQQCNDSFSQPEALEQHKKDCRGKVSVVSGADSTRRTRKSVGDEACEANVLELSQNPSAKYVDIYKNITDKIVNGQTVYSCRLCEAERSEWHLMKAHFVSRHMQRQSSSIEPGDEQEESANNTEYMTLDESTPSQNGTEEYKHVPYTNSLRKMNENETGNNPKTRSVKSGRPRSHSDLDIHLTDGEYKGYPVVTCKFCSKMFTSRYRARRHIIGQHATVKPFQCIYCEKSYLHSFGLEEHLLQHKTEKPYECPKCPIRFASQSLMSNHLLGHFKRTPLLCFRCGEWFMFKYQFDRHTSRTHAGKS